MKCTNCGAALADSAKFCPECGTKVVREVFCAECGTKLEAGVKFCPECGTKVGGAASAQAPAAKKESYPKDNGSSKWLTIEDGVLTKCDEEAHGKVIVPEGVKEIGASAFKDCKALESIKIPASVSEISSAAFCGCESLESIELPDGLETIGLMAFCGCKALKAIKLPDGLETIRDTAFLICKSLESIELPDSVKTIGNYAFKGSGLKQVNYKGKMEEWIEVEKCKVWLDSTETTKVHCSDGILDVVDVKENASADELYNLGRKYFRGNGEKTDPNDLVAAELFIRAAKKGLADAQELLATMYFFGWGLYPNDKKAAEWFEKAAEQGKIYAQSKIAQFYAEGNGVAKNIQKAIEWYKKAAEQGDEDARAALKRLQQQVHEESATNNGVKDTFKKPFGGLFGKK